MYDKKHILRIVVLVAALGVLSGLVSQCSDDPVSPEPPSRISIESGNDQYSLRGTLLPDPLVVNVRTAAGSVSQDAHVVFSIIEGDGNLSETLVRVDGQGLASTRYTLGETLGAHIIRAAIQENTSRAVIFEATSSNFFCPEQDDTFRVSYGSAKDFFLATQRSSWFPAQQSSGVVRIGLSPLLSTRAFREIPGSMIYDSVIFDAAFSARGDFYVARRAPYPEILKIEPNLTMTKFADLDLHPDLPDANKLFVEIATNPGGLLVGCDITGPFIVGCDTLIRFTEATFTRGINNDALAVNPWRQSEDPLGEDIYFIDTTDPRLLRLPMDSLDVETPGVPAVTVTVLTQDEADFARGMACDDRDGTIYILVDGDDTKELLEVTTDGTLSVLYDFFDRGAGDAAGMQRDLAIISRQDRLFTLDTLNDDLLVFDIGVGKLNFPVFTDSLLKSTLSNLAGDGSLTGGERVGLAVLK